MDLSEATTLESGLKAFNVNARPDPLKPSCKLAALSDAVDYFVATVDGLDNKVFKFKDRAWELVSFQALDAGVMLNKDHGNHPNETSRRMGDKYNKELLHHTIGSLIATHSSPKNRTWSRLWQTEHCHGLRAIERTKVDMIKEQFSKLLLEEDMSRGGAKESIQPKKSETRTHLYLLHFIKDPVEIVDREVKRLKQSRIPIVKVRWSSLRGPEFTWKREDQIKQSRIP
ncbi:hypothetical protein Tco_1362349 [Tanacetum coccineum]